MEGEEGEVKRRRFFLFRNKDDLKFMKTDIDYTFGPSHKINKGSIQSSWVPIIRIFHVYENGETGCAFVHGFLPYMYVETNIHVELNSLRYELEEYLANKSGYEYEYDEKQGEMVLKRKGYKKRENFVHNVEYVKKHTIYGYTSSINNKIIKLTLIRPQHISSIRDYLESKQNVLCIYECNVEFVIRFMVDIGIKGYSWIKVKNGEYNTPDSLVNRKTLCDIEFDVHYKNIIPISDCDKIAPIRILSFDIECKSESGDFPKPENLGDKVIQIAIYMKTYGTNNESETVLCLGKSDPITNNHPNATIECFENEKKLLIQFSRIIKTWSPQIITVSVVFQDRAKFLLLLFFRNSVL